MKLLVRLFQTVHGSMARLFAIAALMLTAIAARMGWVVFAGGLDRAAAQSIIEAVGLLAGREHPGRGRRVAGGVGRLHPPQPLR